MPNLKFAALTVAEIWRGSENSKSRGRGYNKKCVLNRGLELMKLIFAVSDVSLTIGFTRCYKTEGFLHLLVYRTIVRDGLSIAT